MIQIKVKSYSMARTSSHSMWLGFGRILALLAKSLFSSLDQSKITYDLLNKMPLMKKYRMQLKWLMHMISSWHCQRYALFLAIGV